MASNKMDTDTPTLPDLVDLIEHQVSVPVTLTVAAVYEVFKGLSHEFLAVTDGRQMVGLVSRGHVGFLLGARFGFAVFGRQGISQHLLPQYLQITSQTPLLTVFETALSRQGDYFYDDVALVDNNHNYLGMISVQTLVRLQTQMIAEKVQLAEKQRLELEEKNQQLFRNVNELRQSQGRYEILFENAALGVALLNRHGLIDTCNRRLERLIGIAMPAALGQFSLPNFIQPNERERFVHLLQELELTPSGQSPSAGEFTVLLPGQGPRLFKFFLNWIQETGQVCALLDDITEQRVLERRMQQKEKSALLESLVGGIAHEINNKLSPIIGYADLMSSEIRQLHGTKDLENYCLIIRDSALESAKIIRQLLQLSRPHNMEMTRCDLKQIVEDAVNFLRFRLRDLGCEVNLKLPAHECWFMADGPQIKQVILNLILNAADAMDGRPRRQLGVEIEPSAEQFQLLISDTGHGIKPEHIARIFDPFFTTKTPDRGTGLGLSVCYSVIKQHNGDISVAETSDQGSVFKITLPRREAPVSPGLSRRAQTGADFSFQSRRVLIADDEDFVSSLVHETLRLKLGCHVDKARDGHDAVKQIGRTEYDLVISDVRMPNLDGFGLLEWVRTNRPALVSRFMFITGDAGSAILNQKLENSEITVLRKPFDVETLLDICKQKLKLPRQNPRVV